MILRHTQCSLTYTFDPDVSRDDTEQTFAKITFPSQIKVSIEQLFQIYPGTA